jgi:hypothetical protein
MSEIDLPSPGDVVKTTAAYVKDLSERVLSTFVVTAAGVAVAAGPADMFHASFWESVAAGGIAAVGSLLKGLFAKNVGEKNSASLVKEV